MVFNDASPTWATWAQPWFTATRVTGENWAKWVHARRGRSLVITQSIAPSAAPSNWRARGAAGAYDRWYRILGENLVRDGLGRSIIRLAPEANFKPGVGSAGSTAAQLQQWRQFWARGALALKSVPGSHFRLDWAVNAGYRPLPFSSYYPGSKAVDIIGVDAYDDLVNGHRPPPGPSRWHQIYAQPDGLAAVLAFARQQGKPLSVPEWGLLPRSQGGGGDDAAYVSGMASVFDSTNLAYESYFNPPSSTVLRLQEAPQASSVYRSLVLHQRHRT